MTVLTVLTVLTGDISVVAPGTLLPTGLSYTCGWAIGTDIATGSQCAIELRLVHVTLNSVISDQTPFEAVTVTDVASVRS